eukprot:gb/GEZJ01008646.1/.p2 GENE.gb/GEZJ01008646.1/~~gb/GEZJ01008646.1/.p2  ORF type:complete len:117 (+),score=6.83 gb/GEZJ01008646.1/:50-352(+)
MPSLLTHFPNVQPLFCIHRLFFLYSHQSANACNSLPQHCGAKSNFSPAYCSLPHLSSATLNSILLKTPPPPPPQNTTTTTTTKNPISPLLWPLLFLLSQS